MEQELALWLHFPICTRHEEEGHDERTFATFFYALGLLDNRAKAIELAKKVVSLHDRKGDLYVTCTDAVGLGGEQENVIRQAWEEMGNELGENVHFE